jgi:hypothetical protein
MSNENTKKEWEQYREEELARVTPLLSELGYELAAEQPHLYGERFLMQNVTTASGRKLILLGSRTEDGARVVIKATSDEHGMRELAHERTCRDVLQTIKFAYRIFATPEELLYTKKRGTTISIQRFIPQDAAFLERALSEQFTYALDAFKAQESAHAATYEQANLVEKTFGNMDAKRYLAAFARFRFDILAHVDDERVKDTLARAEEYLAAHERTIEQYCGFLTHTDFVPHNFRIADGRIYLLDNSSLRFGNKYEGWARFLNFMTLYNRGLEIALLTYVRENRTKEESLSLSLMRVYRLGEIISYYVKNTELSSGDLKTLNNARIYLWANVLEATLRGQQVSDDIIDTYTKLRDSLRSEDEKRRQKDLH